MKNKTLKIATLFAFVILMASCNSDEKGNTPKEKGNTQEEPKKELKTEVVTNFLNDVKSLESIEKGNEITEFQKIAEYEASKIVTLSKDNIADVLVKAKDYKHCVITTSDHTIVLITNLEDCKQSGSWGACMPYAKGYIKKGTLSFKEDYINNIIGLPDSQERKAYLFE